MKLERHSATKYIQVAGSAVFLSVVLWFIVDWSIFTRIYESALGWIGGYGALVAFFMWLSWRDGKTISVADVKDIAVGAAVLVLVFAFMTGGRGCSGGGANIEDCRPAGPGIYNDC